MDRSFELVKVGFLDGDVASESTFRLIGAYDAFRVVLASTTGFDGLILGLVEG